MKVVIQRVKHSKVEVDGAIVGAVQKGFLVLLGIEEFDTQEDVDWLSRKIVNMRIFSDEEGYMNLSLQEVNGEILLVSQFTLHASTRKGNRPSFIKAAKPGFSNEMYEKMKAELSNQLGVNIQSGKFGADMQVSLLNDGPVTIVLDSKNKK
ncbi:MAG: D-tyrosyl-tRNA(Tyr) deacylase [Flavobacteriales bacterium]|nr:D-tyrosyl-tRNA(Tyr) deacylase [Flavobacteriales bacterium]